NHDASAPLQGPFARMKYVIYGAGAIGGTLAAQLHKSGSQVIVVARGEHGKVLREQGLRYRTPQSEERVAIPALPAIAQVNIDRHDLIILTTKSHDTQRALEDL